MLSEAQAKKMLGEVTELDNDAIEHFRTKRSGLRRTVENAAYYRGLQHILQGAPAPGEKAQTTNIIRPIVTKAVADTLRQMPEPRTPAAKDDQKARNAARQTQRLCKAAVRTGIIDEDEIHRTVSWMKQTGAAWLKMFWDPNAGPPVVTGQTGFEKFMSVTGVAEANDSPEDMGIDDIEIDEGQQTTLDVPSGLFEDSQATNVNVDDGFGNMVTPTYKQGEVQCEFVPTTDGFPDPSARTRQELYRDGYFVQKKMRTVREWERRYKKDIFGKTTKGRFQSSTRSMEQAAYQAITEEETEHLWVSNTGKEAHGNVLAEVIEHWEPASDEFGAGRLVVYSGDLILYMGPNIYQPARIPFVLFNGDNIVPGRLYADGIVEDIKQLQKNVNFNETKLFEQLDQVVNFHVMAPFGSGITRNTWGNKSGQVVNYNPGMKPEPWNPPNLNSVQFEYSDTQVARAMLIAGYNRMLQDLPSNTSGRTYAFAEEASQRMREPDQMGFRRAFYEVFQHFIWLVRQFYDTGRKVKLSGENNEWELVDFDEETFDMKADIVFEVYAEGPLSHASKVDEVLNFAQQGVFEDSPIGERARKMLGDDYAYKMAYDPFEVHRQRARRENAQLQRFDSTPVTVKTNDNHKIHLEEHDKFELSPEFEELPIWQQDKMVEHRLTHEQIARAQAVFSISDQAGLQTQVAAQVGAGMPNQPPQMGAGGAPPPQPAQAAGATTAQGPAAPPSMDNFNKMSDSEQRSADQA